MTKRELATRSITTILVVFILFYGVSLFNKNEKLAGLLDPAFRITNTPVANTKTKPQVLEAVKTEYAYKAYNGDSVTTLGRFAIANFSLDSATFLNKSEALFVETQLAQDYNYRKLKTGQEISFTKKRLSELFNLAVNMEPAQKIAWASY